MTALYSSRGGYFFLIPCKIQEKEAASALSFIPSSSSSCSWRCIHLLVPWWSSRAFFYILSAQDLWKRFSSRFCMTIMMVSLSLLENLYLIFFFLLSFWSPGSDPTTGWKSDSHVNLKDKRQGEHQHMIPGGMRREGGNENREKKIRRLISSDSSSTLILEQEEKIKP